MTNQAYERSRAATPDDPFDYILPADLQPERDRMVDLLLDWTVGERCQQVRIDRADAGSHHTATRSPRASSAGSNTDMAPIS